MVEKKTFPVPPRSMPVEWVSETYSVSRRTLAILVREGLVEIERDGSVTALSPEMIERVRMIMALRKDLGVNMAGIEIILRLRHQLLWYRNRSRGQTGESCIDIDLS
ncbi:MAG: MerR family transcriptional regulator [Nitrospirae bacterium]|nr:MerR family transcriptional regulator [Nitrospirota bacterium]MCL5285336.1 MerR family transcriptional regulator [Nitrospirota bacterium]